MEIIVWNVDTQNDFMNEDGALSVPKAREIVDNVSSILRTAENSHIKILGSADEHTDSSAEFESNGGIFPPHCVKGTNGQLNIRETYLGPGRVGIARWHQRYSAAELEGIFSKPQVILTKDDNDVFTSPHIDALLKTVPRGATIYVTGVATEYCDACALRGLARYSDRNGMGWKIAVVTDAVKEITEQGKIDAFTEFRSLGIMFVSTSDVLRHMESVAHARTMTLKSEARAEPQRNKIR